MHACIGEGNGNPLQCSCLENPRDGGAWWAAVYGVAQIWTRLKRLSSSSVAVSLLSIVQLFATPWTAAHQASLYFTISQIWLKLTSNESVMPPNHLILYRFLHLLTSIFPSIRVYSSESALCIRWPECCSFSFSISPSNDYPGLISFRIDWFDLLAVQGTLKSLLQQHSSKASILPCSDLFLVQLTSVHDYWETIITSNIQAFVGKVMSLLSDALSRFVITFHPRSKCLLIPSLQSPSAVILEPKKIDSVSVSIVSLSTCHEVMGPDAMIFVF